MSITLDCNNEQLLIKIHHKTNIVMHTFYIMNQLHIYHIMSFSASLCSTSSYKLLKTNQPFKLNFKSQCIKNIDNVRITKHWGALCNHCRRGRAISLTYSECKCSLSYPACKQHAPYYILICGLSDSTIFFHITS